MKSKDDRPIILIVDDEQINITILRELLLDEYSISSAKNGEEALTFIGNAAKMPDLILLDINMPGIDGYEVCIRIKKDIRTQNIPIIFVSACNDSFNEVKAFDLGAVEYIKKPFYPIIVKARVRNQIILKRQNELLSKMAFYDFLTGLHNRRSFDDELEKLWKKDCRENNEFSIVMIDIDNFKDYNDYYGHGAGDECLREIGHSLERSLNRPLDVIARYGGEEFVIILPQTNKEGAKNICNKMLHAVRERAIPHNPKIGKMVTISIGYSTIRASNEICVSEVLNESDKALYIAKENGKNRIDFSCLN